MDKNKPNFQLYIVATVFIIIGAVFLVRGFKEKSLVDEGFEDYSELSYKDLEDGMLVEGEFYYAYGTFAEEYETNYGIRLSDDSEVLYYAVIAGTDEEFITEEYRYVGFKCTESWFDKMDTLSDQTDKFLLGETTTEPTPVKFTAKVTDMSDEVYGFMEEAFVEQGIDESEMDYYIHPVILSPYNKDSYKAELYVGIGGIAIGVVVLAIGLVLGAKKKKEEDIYY